MCFLSDPDLAKKNLISIIFVMIELLLNYKIMEEIYCDCNYTIIL